VWFKSVLRLWFRGRRCSAGDVGKIADAMERIRSGTFGEWDWDDFFSFSHGDDEVDTILRRAGTAGLFELVRHGGGARDDVIRAVDECIRDLRALAESRRITT